MFPLPAVAVMLPPTVRLPLRAAELPLRAPVNVLVPVTLRLPPVLRLPLKLPVVEVSPPLAASDWLKLLLPVNALLPLRVGTTVLSIVNVRLPPKVIEPPPLKPTPVLTVSEGFASLVLVTLASAILLVVTL